MILTPSAIARGSWRYCGGGSGGAFAIRVLGIDCRYAAYVTESGLRAGLRATRAGSFACVRRRSGSFWSYRCVRARGRQGLAFDTY
jgi:hypothetical protein